jgi:hypothetical protein
MLAHPFKKASARMSNPAPAVPLWWNQENGFRFTARAGETVSATDRITRQALFDYGYGSSYTTAGAACASTKLRAGTKDYPILKPPEKGQSTVDEREAVATILTERRADREADDHAEPSVRDELSRDGKAAP